MLEADDDDDVDEDDEEEVGGSLWGMNLALTST